MKSEAYTHSMSSQAPHSETARLEAFSDGVFAIIITIMMLEIKVPHETSIHALLPLVPVLLSYILSFIYVAIYWNNHHHLLHAADGIAGGVMWANMHLLFWLSLVPFGTQWIGENHHEAVPAAVYGFILLMAACAYFILQQTIIRNEGQHSAIARAIGRDRKGRVSIVLYFLSIGAAFLQPWISYGLFVIVALMWIAPDKRLKPIFDHVEKYRLKSVLQ